MRFQAEGVTDVGRRRQGNEDGMLVDDDLRLLAVADGMGGHRGGEVASATALESLRASIASGMAIREAIEAANDAVFERAAADPGLSGMGTTLTAVTVGAGNALILGHVGDSRAYLMRDGELRQVSEDHSLVEEMVRDGRLTREQAANHPQRSIITRALGVDPDVDVDVEPLELEPGDRIMLCSDGLTTMVAPDQIAEILRGTPDPGDAADQLIDAANAAGGDDNITAVVADFAPDEEGAAPVAAAAAPVAPAPTRAERRQARPRRRKVLRVALIALPVLLILGLGFGATAWYARSNYFVGIDDATVTVYKGLPDGLLIWDPTVEETTDIDVDDLTEAQQSDLEDGKRFSSKESADEYVARLQDSIDKANEQDDSDTDGGGGGGGGGQNDQQKRNRNRTSTTTTTTTTTAPPPPAGP